MMELFWLVGFILVFMEMSQAEYELQFQNLSNTEGQL